MFNVGDEVTVVEDYPITKEGDIGTIISTNGRYFRVRFHTMALKDFVGHEFEFRPKFIRHIDGKSSSAIERKIKRMYERQSYFLRHRSGQPAS